MNIELLTIDNDIVVPGIECYTIPELKTILDNFSKEDSIEIFTYLHFLYNPKSPFNNVPEKDREATILLKVRSNSSESNWSTDSIHVLKAKKLVESLYMSPTRRFFLDAKAGLEKIGAYIRSTKVTDGKDGNFAALSVNYTRVGKIMEDFKKLEKMVEDEEKIQIRGDQEISDI